MDIDAGRDPKNGNPEGTTPDEGTSASNLPASDGSEGTQEDSWNFTVDGKSFSNPKEAQEHFKRRIGDKDSYINQLESELGEVRGQMSRLEGRIDELGSRNNQPDPNEMSEQELAEYYDNPVKFIQRKMQEQKAEYDATLKSKEQEVNRKLEQQEKIKKFWDDYYSKNEEHKRFDNTLVKLASSQLNSELPKNTPLRVFSEKLADRVNDLMLDIGKSINGDGATNRIPKPGASRSRGFSPQGDGQPKDITMDELARDAVEFDREQASSIRPSYSRVTPNKS